MVEPDQNVQPLFVTGPSRMHAFYNLDSEVRVKYQRAWCDASPIDVGGVCSEGGTSAISEAVLELLERHGPSK